MGGRIQGGAMNKRRKLILALGARAYGPFASFAQQPPAKFYRIGFLGATSAAGMESRLEAFRAGMRDLGYVEGKNLMIEFRWAEGKYDRLPALAAELVRLNVELIVTGSTPGVRAAKQATTTIPIVIGAVGDALAASLVASLARPGGNVTGSTFFQPELAAKRIELLKEVKPQVAEVAFLMNLDNAGSTPPSLRPMEVTAKALKVGLQPFPVRESNDFDSAFAAMAKKRIDAVVINEDPMLVSNMKAIADLALKWRLLSAGSNEFPQAGGLLGYSPNVPELYRRAATFADKIFKGAKPADLPVEQPTRFEMVVNMKTAKALQLKIPNSILVRAEKVIE
jgi:putative ABC transport system substrate-binding protein